MHNTDSIWLPYERARCPGHGWHLTDKTGTQTGKCTSRIAYKFILTVTARNSSARVALFHTALF